MTRITSGSDPATIEVDLVDDEVPRTHRAAPAGAGADAPRSRRPARRRRRAMQVTALAVVLAAVGVAQLVESTDRPTGDVVRGRIGSVPVAPAELWRAPASMWSYVDGEVVVHGSLAGVVAHDLRTGEVLADLSTEVGRCLPASDLQGGPVVTSVVLCTAWERAGGVPVVTLRAVRPAQGRTAWSVRVPGEALESVVHLVVDGGDAPAHGAPVLGRVVALERADALWAVRERTSLHLARVALDDGTVRWSTELPHAATEGMWLEPRDGAVLVSGRVLVDLATGEPLGEPADGEAPPPVEAPVRVPGGVARLDGAGTGEGPVDGRTTVSALDGTVRFARGASFPVGWAAVVADDADVVVLADASDGSRVVLDAGTGAELWRLESLSAFWDVMAYLPDLLVVRGGSHLYAYDARTGEERWTVSIDPNSWAPALVDDRRLVASARAPGQGSGLQAVDVRSGEVVWTVPLPSPVRELRPVDDVLVVQMDAGVVVLGTG